MIKSELNTNEYHEYYSRYIDKLTRDTDLIEGYKVGKNSMISFINMNCTHCVIRSTPLSHIQQQSHQHE